MTFSKTFAMCALVGLGLLSGCGSKNRSSNAHTVATSNPLILLQKALAASEEYSIILEDMKEEGNFVDNYYHKYKYISIQQIVGQEEPEVKESTTDWLKVSPEIYRTYESALGMVVASKDAEGKETNIVQPPGYQYVGNERYGQWRTQSDGSRFWEFYGKFDYDGYRTSYRSGRPYYGTNNQWGTRGTYAQKTHPTFFQRQQQRQASSKSRFSEKVKSKTSRSNMSSVRSRSSSSRGGK